MIIQRTIKLIMQIDGIDEHIISRNDEPITPTPNARIRNSSKI
jgi:hypothetical protein